MLILIFSLAIGKLTIMGNLGEGRNGKVKKVCRADNPFDQFALKSIVDDKYGVNEGHREYKVLKYLQKYNHRNIIKLEDAWLEKFEKQPKEEKDSVSENSVSTCVYIMLEYCEMDAMDYFKSIVLQPVDEKAIVLYEFIRQTADALSFMHSKHLFHLDFKPSNVLLKSMNVDPLFKLTDFDMTRGSESIIPYNLGVYYYSPNEAFAKITQPPIGTKSAISSEKFDVYSFGKSVKQLMRLLDGQIFTNYFHYAECVTEDNQVDSEGMSYFTDQYKQVPKFQHHPKLQWLVGKTMHCNPENRPTMQEIKSFLEIDDLSIPQTTDDEIKDFSDNSAASHFQANAIPLQYAAIGNDRESTPLTPPVSNQPNAPIKTTLRRSARVKTRKQRYTGDLNRLHVKSNVSK